MVDSCVFSIILYPHCFLKWMKENNDLPIFRKELHVLHDDTCWIPHGYQSKSDYVEAQTKDALQWLAKNQQGTQGEHVGKHTKKGSQPDVEKCTISFSLLTQQSGKNNPPSSQCYTAGGKIRASLGIWLCLSLCIQCCCSLCYMPFMSWCYSD